MRSEQDSPAWTRFVAHGDARLLRYVMHVVDDACGSDHDRQNEVMRVVAVTYALGGDEAVWILVTSGTLAAPQPNAAD